MNCFQRVVNIFIKYEKWEIQFLNGSKIFEDILYFLSTNTESTIVTLQWFASDSKAFPWCPATTQTWCGNPCWTHFSNFVVKLILSAGNSTNPLLPNKCLLGFTVFPENRQIVFCFQNCSSDQEKPLKFEAEGREFAKKLRSLNRTIYSNSEKSEQFLKQNSF